ncbi:trans-AT polyketide synthase/acyltransferase/oxidoreductase domain-containing protein [Bradyrhizobium sp. USDA 4524]|uniref:PfaD family polyunsaturated fatty acid/polyketide biosynthesis protein n=1 Tax=unclassified Bradyrhizobium TaxID=2631580 RepID=UPI0020A145FF|nr:MULTISPECIES: PfaD family polyunsaturated fatty acid/polyketide biosynthesis protein [unclassified Bradyrhizobium]MCP1846016.1 trans-AT polyketide synthase/acyltransferase/oxidoreductase domain-containing protein [Bradyrhizobium sp. USDA 4538]MCP1907350.1 trans-AT polyketide synthase/acyltransferase/oxidoreductase domain-containing protein [Bradyrhizobium sp. USDA 4537]MCP1985136.1 trans-AT polyketide synthase/acyltransferase/oxidoreductase domain-containing protein [Bradyrhizobium sp. USDA 4
MTLSHSMEFGSPSQSAIRAEALGSAQFRADYGLKYAYLAGAMYKGIASVDLVVALGRAGFMGYLGTGGLSLVEVEAALRNIQSILKVGEPYGANLLFNPDVPALLERTVDLYLDCQVRHIEAAAFVEIVPALVRYRLHEISRERDGAVRTPNRVLAKVSRPEVAAQFMKPAPEPFVRQLLEAGILNTTQAELSQRVPMADDVCVEADSGGHTDQGMAYALLPAILFLRDKIMQGTNYERMVRVGAAGGIGTPHAAAAAFAMGADFVLTGSINQCTVEARTSEVVKQLLQGMNVQDTTYAPAGDMFEAGSKVQVLRKGRFFAARANKLYELYQRYDCLEDIDAEMRQHIETKIFGRSFDAVWCETAAYYATANPAKLLDAERHPKRKMALIFKWYFIHSMRLALRGATEQSADFQIHCSPALGAFNQWVKGTHLESWRNRYVAEVAAVLMNEAAALLTHRLCNWVGR